MPHKRAKRADRLIERQKQGDDLPPTDNIPITHEKVPKSLARVLNAESLRNAYTRKRSRDNDQADDERPTKRRFSDASRDPKKLHIKRGESLAHFNRRVEDDMRTSVAAAMHSSRNRTKRMKKSGPKKDVIAHGESVSNDDAPRLAHSGPSDPSRRARVGKTEFETSPAAKRLNDIVQAPPVFTKLPRGATRGNKGSDAANSHGAVSMAQKLLMVKERESAIQRYRKLKDSRLTGGTSEHSR